MRNHMDIFKKLDAMRIKVEASKIEPLYSNEVNSRNNRYQTTVVTENNNLLRVMATLIAFSNNAPSDLVGNIIENGVFERIFNNYKIDSVASMNPEQIVEREWHNIRSIRFKKKINAIIDCSKLLLKNGKEMSTIESLYKNYKIPKDIKHENDINEFWYQYDKLLLEYGRINMPYFKNDTTLLHLLLHLGFPCIKPDLIVMKVAASLEMVKPRENHNTYSTDEKRLVVKTIQRYCLQNNIKPAVMDLIILIYGGQKYAVRYVS